MKGKRIENLPPDYLSRLAAQKGSGREKILTLLRIAGDFGVHSSTIRKLGISGHPPERARELEAQGYEIERKREYIDGRNGVRFYLLSEPAVELTAGVDSANREGSAVVHPASLDRPAPTSVGDVTGARSSRTVDPGEQSAAPTGVPSSKESDSDTNPAVPSASEEQRGRDRQVRGAGSPSTRRNQAQAAAEAANATRGTAATQPARLSEDARAGSGVTSHTPEPAPRTLSLLPDPDPETWAA